MIFSSVGYFLEILLSTHVLDDLEEALAHSVGFAAVEAFRVAVFSHIHSVEVAISVLTHNNAILVTVRIAVAVIFPDIIWEFVCSCIVQVAHLIVREILTGHNVIIIIFNSVMVLMEAKVSVSRTVFRDNITITKVDIVLSKPIQQVQAMSRPRLTEAGVFQLRQFIQGAHHDADCVRERQ